MINAETSQPGGTKDDVAMGSTARGRRDLPREPTRARTRSYTTPSSRRHACSLSYRSLHVLDDQEALESKKPKKQLRAYSEMAATEGKGHGLGLPRKAAFTNLLQALSERGSTVERQTRREWQISIKRGTIWNWMEISIWYLIATWPKCTSMWHSNVFSVALG